MRLQKRNYELISPVEYGPHEDYGSFEEDESGKPKQLYFTKAVFNIGSRLLELGHDPKAHSLPNSGQIHEFIKELATALLEPDVEPGEKLEHDHRYKELTRTLRMRMIGGDNFGKASNRSPYAYASFTIPNGEEGHDIFHMLEIDLTRSAMAITALSSKNPGGVVERLSAVLGGKKIHAIPVNHWSSIQPSR